MTGPASPPPPPGPFAAPESFGASEPFGAPGFGAPGFGGPPVVPPPPAGPGVQAPFATPPTERDRKRLWIGLGVGAALLVVCCGGGAFGFGALLVNRAGALRTEAVAVVRQYLNDLRAESYSSAYRLLCSDLRNNMNQAEFTSREHDRPRVVQFAIGSASLSGSQVLVPAEVVGEDGSTRHPTFALVEEDQPAALRICSGG